MPMYPPVSAAHVPDSKKKYFPVLGAVKIPDVMFIAPPILSLANSNDIGVVNKLKLLLLWTEK